jgi:hypothetical protein
MKIHIINNLHALTTITEFYLNSFLQLYSKYIPLNFDSHLIYGKRRDY